MNMHLDAPRLQLPTNSTIGSNLPNKNPESFLRLTFFNVVPVRRIYRIGEFLTVGPW